MDQLDLDQLDLCVCMHPLLFGSRERLRILLNSHQLSFSHDVKDATNMAAGPLLVLRLLVPLASDGHEGASAAHPGDGI